MNSPVIIPLVDPQHYWQHREFWEKRSSLYRHVKRGSTYRLMAIVPYRSFNHTTICDDDHLVIIKGYSNLFVTAQSEVEHIAYVEVCDGVTHLEINETRYIKLRTLSFKITVGTVSRMNVSSSFTEAQMMVRYGSVKLQSFLMVDLKGLLNLRKIKYVCKA